MTQPDGTLAGFAEWCIVELFGHQKFAGHLTQADWPPGFGRLEIPATDGHGPATQLINPASIYRLTPTTEDIALRVAASCRPKPVSRWELEPTRPAIPEATMQPSDYGLSYDNADVDDDDDEPGPAVWPHPPGGKPETATQTDLEYLAGMAEAREIPGVKTNTFPSGEPVWANEGPF